MTAITISGLRWWMIGPILPGWINNFLVPSQLRDASLMMSIDSAMALEPVLKMARYGYRAYKRMGFCGNFVGRMPSCGVLREFQNPVLERYRFQSPIAPS